MTKKKFQKIIWDYYATHKRNLPWRNTRDPYNILVSEFMLQQTQVSRVILKYPQFIKELSSFNDLSNATLKQVLSLWQGLGYNRRALYLHTTAKLVFKKYNGEFPNDPKIIKSFPGIGEGTAGAVRAFAFNKPDVFIETNIRRTFIHSFHLGKNNIRDSDLLPLIEDSIDRKNPREWYYALMDYGAMLGKQAENPNRKSHHYSKQPKFEGSDRQIRGHIIRNLLIASMKEKELLSDAQFDRDRIKKVLSSLEKEGLIYSNNRTYYIT